MTIEDLTITGTKSYIAKSGEMFDMVALAAYGDEGMASILLQANPEYASLLIFEGGEILTIPIIDNMKKSESLPPWRK